MNRPPETFTYDHWRHGGWYVAEVRWPNGGCGCVSRQILNPATGTADRKWRIVCDPREEDHTYPNRDAAALAEWHLTQPPARLEYLRGLIRAECIHWGELAELQDLADHIAPGDVELAEWVGIPEDEFSRRGSK